MASAAAHFEAEKNVPALGLLQPRGRKATDVFLSGYLPAFDKLPDTFENVVFKLLPTEFTATIIATEMPAAISPYSIAVAPDSSLRKRFISFFMTHPVLCRRGLAPPRRHNDGILLHQVEAAPTNSSDMYVAIARTI